MVTCKVKFHKKSETVRKHSDDYEWGGTWEEHNKLDTCEGVVMDSSGNWWNVKGSTRTAYMGSYPAPYEEIEVSYKNITYTIEPRYHNGFIGYYESVFDYFRSKYNILDDILRAAVDEYDINKAPKEIKDLWSKGGHYGEREKEVQSIKAEKHESAYFDFTVGNMSFYIRNGKFSAKESQKKLVPFLEKVIKPEILEFIEDGYIDFDFNYQKFKYSSEEFISKGRTLIVTPLNKCKFRVHVENKWVNITPERRLGMPGKKVVVGPVDANESLKSFKEKFLNQLTEDSLLDKIHYSYQYPEKAYSIVSKLFTGNLSDRFNYKASSDEKFMYVYIFALNNRDKYEKLIDRMKSDLEKRNLPDIDPEA